MLKTYRSSAPAVAVLFVKADWCPHCRTAKPEVEKAAAILGSVVPVYAVDADRQGRTVEELGVDGFPTILFRDARGKLHTYTKEREGRKIADWVCARSGKCSARRR
jgi:thiol-disulfide isomerase/thioredoxin